MDCQTSGSSLFIIGESLLKRYTFVMEPALVDPKEEIQPFLENAREMIAAARLMVGKAKLQYGEINFAVQPRGRNIFRWGLLCSAGFCFVR